MTLKLSKLLAREEPLSEKEHVFILSRIHGLIDEVRRRKVPDLLINAYMLGIQDAALGAQAAGSIGPSVPQDELALTDRGEENSSAVSQSTSALAIEIWRQAVGLEGRYEVSSLGRVRSVDRVVNWGVPRSDGSRRTRMMAGRVLALQWGGEGYAGASVSTADGPERRAVHRMVCWAFNGAPPFRGALCRHFDDDKTRNLPGNLGWGTVAENAADAVKNGRVARGERIGLSKATEAQVREIKALYIPRHPVHGAKALAARLGVSRYIVSSIVAGRTWAWL